MTGEEWETVALLLSKGWKGEFGPGEDRAYRLILDAYRVEDVVLALRRIAVVGHHAIPSVSEIVGAIERDVSRPTFEEACRLIYGMGGILRAMPPYAGPASRTPGKLALACRERIAAVHPLVGSFVQRFGVERLRLLELEDPEWGGKHLRDLRDAWDRHCEAMEGRNVEAVVAAGDRTGRRLKGLDPLALLGVAKPAEVTTTEVEERD